ncbi:glycosyltransferase [Salipaludibacillus keqinensis]|uniref:Glycosyltransferase n=1 Tax=Salipaludibacillus keqinensis TaxID=2045207 RepID=A0A323TIQ7_9BACI|nr:glycosyltransferase family A protein [Salipaludibacillus keqinensis]PYZ92543.1 glycosyltransferase [Salipaludibacillus keqinensis]
MTKVDQLKHSLKGKLTKDQKELIKRVVPFIGLPTTQIQLLKHKLNNLGFTERGLKDLEAQFHKAKNLKFKKYIAWELALWHTNQYTKTDAKKALDYLEVVLQDEENKEKVRRATILTAEAMKRLGFESNGKRLLTKVIKENKHPDLYLAGANLEEGLQNRIAWINKVYRHYGLMEIKLNEQLLTEREPYDAIEMEMKKTLVANKRLQENKVTVLMPMYNSEDVIHSALSSVQQQTWTNLEIIVIDDCSTDSTVKAVKKYQAKDDRITLIKAEENGGPYVARNLALNQATGEFVTINDADDWSHPEKIEKQVLHLIKNDKLVGNMSEQARMTNHFEFFRRARPGEYLFNNMSSFMFRRQQVLEKLGYWDSVRFAGDSEFIYRVKKVFGEYAVEELQTGPLSFQRQTDTSLTGNEVFGLPNYKMGARREYEMAHDHYHKNSKNLNYSFPQQVRPFAIPEPMRPEKEQKTNGYRKFDLIFVADFRNESALTKEDRAKLVTQSPSMRIGFVQLYRYDTSPYADVHSIYRELLNDGHAEMIVYGEKVECDRCVISGLACLNEFQRYVPELKAKEAVFLVKENEKMNPSTPYAKRIQHYVHAEATGYPVSDKARKAYSEGTMELAKTTWRDFHTSLMDRNQNS